jgi:hypothetical protein
VGEVWLESPYRNDGSAMWLKGNLHTHTTRSDGRHAPQEVVRHYAALGYDFLMLSDHDVVADLAGLDPCGMTLLVGNEVSLGGPHVLDVGARVPLPNDGGMQQLLDAIARDSGFAVLCHPNWEEHFDHYPLELMLALTRYVGVEIFNGGCIGGPGSHLATDKWDRVLTAGKRAFGFASDDAHHMKDAGMGWCVVHAADRSPGAILAALKAGDFYASNGVRIESIRCEGPVLEVHAPDADRIALVGHHARRLHWVDGPVLRFDVGELVSPYVRVECYGRADFAAWSQPLYIRGGEHERMQRRLHEAGLDVRAELRALRADRAPALSGRLDDPLWRDAPAHDRFVRMQDGQPAPVGAELRCILAGDTLHFGLRCVEPLLERVNRTPGQGRSLWNDDGVELFLDVEGRGANYYHLMANAAGDWAVACRGADPVHKPALTVRTGTWQEGAQRGWCLEMAVPVGPFRPRPGSRWGMHCCRNRRAERGTYMWSWVGQSNHNPSQYGALLL